jgi:hypothetical protein
MAVVGLEIGGSIMVMGAAWTRLDGAVVGLEIGGIIIRIVVCNVHIKQEGGCFHADRGL